MIRFLLLLMVGLLAAGAALAQPSRTLLSGDGQPLEFKADVESSASDIDDVFNASAADGWRPRFVINHGGRYRLLFSRARSGEHLPREYKAEVLFFAENIDDRFNEMAAGGWRPVFVFHTGLRYRMLFEREKDPALRYETRYRADKIDETREVDDKFNQYAGDGYRAMFLLSATDSTEIRMLFGRERGEDDPRFRYRATKVWSSREIDDEFNELAEDGWRPVFIFPDGLEYRILFEQLREDDGVRYEYRADLVDEAREIDDKFNQYGMDGWDPVHVFWEEDRMEYRLLFARRVNG